MRGAGAVLAALAVASCVTGSYDRVRFNEPIEPAMVEALLPGTADLQSCLTALGAPNRVFEYQVDADRNSGLALLWFWRDAAGWGVDVSVAVDDASASFEYASQAADLPACVLWFGSDLRLERARLGTIGDLLPDRVRPSPVLDG